MLQDEDDTDAALRGALTTYNLREMNMTVEEGTLIQPPKAEPENPSLTSRLRDYRRADHKVADAYAALAEAQNERRDVYQSLVEAWADAGRPIGHTTLWTMDDGDLVVTLAVDNHQELRVDFSAPLKL